FGVGLLVVSYLKLTQSVLGPFLPGTNTGSVVEVIHAFRLRGRGPRIVAIGGGPGLRSLLRGLKTYTSNLTETVDVDDAGVPAGRDSRGIHQRKHRRSRVADPQAELTDQPRLPQAGRRAGQPRSRAGHPERGADHRRPGLPLHLDLAEPSRRRHGGGDQG